MAAVSGAGGADPSQGGGIVGDVTNLLTAPLKKKGGKKGGDKGGDGGGGQAVGNAAGAALGG